MPQGLTNQVLGQLLRELGFAPGDVTEKNHRVWRHPQSGCTLLLPANKTTELARPADIVGIKAQLHLQGHLDEAAFDLFATEGNLPVR
ncbi:MAG: hypothetical protein HUU20_22920 [Pirellulales bacterium]|nr:hypothetical protein [Pirellulales bacterium]